MSVPLIYSHPLLASVSIYASLLLNPYCIIPCSPTPISGFVSQQSPIPVSPSLASASRKHETVLWPFIPPLSRLGFPLSLLSNLKTSNTSLPGLLPQPEVNTLQDGIISSTALWQYKNSEWTAQSLFHLRFDCNGIACCPWEAPAASPTLGLYDTKWPGYNFSIYSKNSVNNSFGMRRLRSLGRLQPGPSPLSSLGSQPSQKMQGWIANVEGLINLSEFTAALRHSPCTPIDSPKETKNVIFTTSHVENARHGAAVERRRSPVRLLSPSLPSNFTSAPIHHMWWIYVIKPISPFFPIGSY